MTQIKESQFLKKGGNLTNVTEFLASGTILFHFLRKKSTATSGSTFQAEDYSSTVTSFPANSSFRLVGMIFLSTVNG